MLRTFIDAAVGDAEVVALGRMALLFLAIALLNQLFGAGATYAGADVGWRATNTMRAELMRHCLRLDMRFHTAHTAGEMIERIDGDVTALSNFFSQFSVRVLGGMLLLGGILVLLWLENPWIGLALTGFAALQFLVLLRLRSLGVPATKLERENSAQLFGFIEERLAGIEDLRANGGGPHAMHRFGAVIRTFFFGTRRAWLLQSVVWLSSFGLFIVGIGVTLGASIALVTRGIITIGTGYMVFQYMLMLQNPVEQISRQLQELQKAAASIGRVQQLFAERSTLPAGQWPATARQGRSGSSSKLFRLPTTPARPSSRASTCGWRRGRCWACWGAPAVARPASPGCCSGSTTSPRGACGWAVSTPATPTSKRCAPASAWSPRRCSCSRPACATTSPSSTLRSTMRGCASCSRSWAWATGSLRCPTASTPCSPPPVATSRPARRNC